MNITNKAIMRNWITILTIMLIGFIFIGLAIIISSNLLTENATKQFYDYNINEKKEVLKLEVTNRLDEIEFERNNILENEKKLIKEKIEDVTKRLLTSNISPTNVSEVIAAFEDITSDDDYLYFAINTEGTLIKTGTDSKLINSNIIDNLDVEGKYYVQEMLLAVHSPEGIYVDYYWPKEKDGQPLKKTSYCFYIEEYDIIIGTGSYHIDINNTLMETTYKRLQQYYEEKENYVFVIHYDSTALVNGIPSLVGKKMNSQTDLNGQSIHEEFLKIIDGNQQGYLTYQFIDKNNDALSEKISYVHKLEGWDSYIGIGFYTDSLNVSVDAYNNYFKRYFYNVVLFVTVGLILLALMIYALIQKGAFLQKKYLEHEDIVFEKLFEFSGQGILVVSRKGKILYQNTKIDDLFSMTLSHFLTGYTLELSPVNDTIYSIPTESKANYVTLKTEDIAFRGHDSIIYFIEDMTSQYLQTHKFESMAMSDALTGLPNRYALEMDYDLLIQNAPMECHVLGIIDIDHFKKVNDLYGHDTGDKVLIYLADIFKSRLRHTDQFYRYGGEEFIILMSNVELSIAKKIIDNLNVIYREIIQDELGFSSTFSGGLVKLDAIDMIDLSEYIKEADQLLYQAKEKGRNQIKT